MAGTLLATGCDVVLVLEATAPVDVGTVGALARLVLVARRSGARLAIRSADPALAVLVELAGLSDVLAVGETTPGRQPEPR